MLTWKLWRALHDPPMQHPLFARITRKRSTRTGRLAVLLLPVGITLVVALLVISIWRTPPILTTPLITEHSVLLIVLLVFTGTLHGLVWSANISHILVKMRLDGQYDLLRLSISNELQMNWAVCTGYLHRNQSFSRVHTQRARITQYMLMIPAALAMPLMLGIASENEPYVAMLLTTLVHAVAIALAYYIDYAQSVIIGGIIGMAVPIYTRSDLDTRMLSAGAFLSIQIISYALTWWIGFVFLPTVWFSSGTYTEVALTVTRLLIFYGVRELLITVLWSLLLRHLQPESIRI